MCLLIYIPCLRLSLSGSWPWWCACGCACGCACPCRSCVLPALGDSIGVGGELGLGEATAGFGAGLSGFGGIGGCFGGGRTLLCLFF